MSGIVILGVPGSRRVSAFVETANRLQAGPVVVVSYLDFLAGNGFVPPSGSLIRIESPSECAATTRAILKAGIEPLAAARAVPLSAAEIDRLTCERGEMLAPRQWYYGFREILRRCAAEWSVHDADWMSSPAAIETAFDKAACLDRWADLELPIPKQFLRVRTYAELREALPQRYARLFIKLRYGYSAMGAVALEWRDNLVRAITTTEVTWSHGRPRIFVSKRPRTLKRELEIAWLIDTIAMEEIVVEEWLPKARWQGTPYDVRVVMINGRVEHLTGRAHSSPFTNLNLDAKRIPREIVLDQLGPAGSEFETLCESAAHALPGAGYLGLDVLIRPCQQRFALLEANAFGDYLPKLQHRGRTVYEAELLDLRRSHSEACA